MVTPIGDQGAALSAVDIISMMVEVFKDGVTECVKKGESKACQHCDVSPFPMDDEHLEKIFDSDALKAFSSYVFHNEASEMLGLEKSSILSMKAKKEGIDGTRLVKKCAIVSYLNGRSLAGGDKPGEEIIDHILEKAHLIIKKSVMKKQVVDKILSSKGD